MGPPTSWVRLPVQLTMSAASGATGGKTPLEETSAEINPRKTGGINTLENFAGGINTLEKSFGEINPPKPGGIKTLQALESNGETR